MIKDYYKQGLKTYMCTDSYERVKDHEEWLPCPNCELKPLINVFDNGRSAACGCGDSLYDGFRIRAESIMSHTSRTGGDLTGYNGDGLKDNWNHWVLTGGIRFERTDDVW